MGTIIDNLSTLLGELEDNELAYVVERSRAVSDKAGYENAGFSRSAFYRWDKARRDYLNELAQALKRRRAIAAELVLMDKVEEAAQVMVGLLGGGSPAMQFKAARDIMDRMLGAALQRADITTGGERIPTITTVEVRVPSRAEDEEWGDGGLP